MNMNFVLNIFGYCLLSFLPFLGAFAVGGLFAPNSNVPDRIFTGFSVFVAAFCFLCLMALIGECAGQVVESLSFW